MSKIQIWKRITTYISSYIFPNTLYLICQRYKFESESQLPAGWRLTVFAVFNMSKIQIWKRITTDTPCRSLSSPLYLICQRYKFESESQPLSWSPFAYSAVFNMSKIQIWKRITTHRIKHECRSLLYLICQRYKFESESQQWKQIHK